jgi:hypothetical protein
MSYGCRGDAIYRVMKRFKTCWSGNYYLTGERMSSKHFMSDNKKIVQAGMPSTNSSAKGRLVLMD